MTTMQRWEVTAAAMPVGLVTAWEALYDRVKLAAGQSVLIQGGAGGVGHMAVQLAALRGARVASNGLDTGVKRQGSLKVTYTSV
jgi:NADPH:quinone reductase-like Zn-dependent oxidoreductase